MFDVKFYQILNKNKSTFYNKKYNYEKLNYISITIRPIIFLRILLD